MARVQELASREKAQNKVEHVPRAIAFAPLADSFCSRVAGAPIRLKAISAVPVRLGQIVGPEAIGVLQCREHPFRTDVVL